MEYQEALQYLDSFLNFEKTVRYDYRRDFSLERVERFLRRLGNPQERFR